LKLAFTEEQINKRLQEMVLEISKDYGDETVHVVGIMEDGFVFMADLVRKLTCPVVCHFAKFEPQDIVMGSQPIRSISYSPITGVEGQNILLVATIVDSGITLDYLVQHLLLKNPKSVRTATLVDLEDRRRVALSMNYAGFPWNSGHLVGYGLAKDGLYRNLPYIAVIPSAATAA